MKFPYQNEFNFYCKNQKHYTPRTIIIVFKSITTFWNYFKNGTNTENTINDVQSSDIQAFLDSLETNLSFKENTINKYLSHIKLYFTFLYTHHLIENYPVLEINGRKFNRRKTYVIDWMKSLPEISQIPKIHHETVFMMTGISLGFKPDEVLKLRYQTVISKIKDNNLYKYIKNNIYISNYNDKYICNNPYLLSNKHGGYYNSDFHLAQKCFPDRKLIGMDITLQNLRLSYVYSILHQKDLTDKQLQEILRVNDKSLFYYRQNMMMHNNLVEFRLPENS